LCELVTDTTTVPESLQNIENQVMAPVTIAQGLL
jgi:hypothetical protein